MKTSRFYQIIIVVLIVINIVTISIPFFRKPLGPNHNELIKEIGLTGENGKTVSILEVKHHKDKKSLLETRDNFYLSLYDKIGGDSNINTLESINAINAEIDKMTYLFFNDVAKLCNENQKKELDKIIHHLFKKVRKKGK